MEVELEALLATLSLRVRDILNFQVGDVIELNCKPDAPLKLLVEQKPKFLAMAGIQGGKKRYESWGGFPTEDRS